MTTMFIHQHNLCADRCVTEYVNHLAIKTSKIAMSTFGAVALGVVGEARTKEQLVKLADLCEACEALSQAMKKPDGDEKYGTLFLSIVEQIKMEAREDKLYIVYKSDGEPHQCVFDDGTFKHYDISNSYTGTGGGHAEFIIRYMERKNYFDPKEVFEKVSQVDQCTSAEFDMISVSELKDCKDLPLDGIKELLK